MVESIFIGLIGLVVVVILIALIWAAIEDGRDDRRNRPHKKP